MPDNQSAKVTVERATGDFALLFPLMVFIDGKLTGSVRRGGTGEFEVAPGAHHLSVQLGMLRAGPIRLILGQGERMELICQTNQPPFHPLHIHLVWSALLFVALLGVGYFLPEFDKFVREHLIVEVLISFALGMIGLMIFFRKVYTSGAWRPVLILGIKGNPLELGRTKKR